MDHSPRIFSRASSGVWSMSGESVDLHFSDCEFSDNLEFSDTELSPDSPAEVLQEASSIDVKSNVLAKTKFSKTGFPMEADKSTDISSKHKHDVSFCIARE